MEELENLKNPHSRMLFLISKMFKDNEITQETKLNLKYLVFLNDSNLLNILKKRYTNIEDIVADIKYFSKNLTREVVEEELKSSDLFTVNADHEAAEENEEIETIDNSDALASQGSPMGSFLRDRKKKKQTQDKSVSGFTLEKPTQSNGATGNSVVMSCGIGESPKFQPASRRNR